MNSLRLLLIVPALGLAAGCATTAPQELVDARQAYQYAADGPASRLAPAELHIANEALERAEKAFRKDADGYRTRDLSYVAQRKAELARVTASIATEKSTQSQARSEFQDEQSAIVEETKQDLSKARTDLATSERSEAETAAKLKAAEAREAAALAALAKLAAVRDEPRGRVITFSGSVLFASNRSALLPAARERLDAVAEVLLTSRERTITIEGHTDSQGSERSNLDLSQRRADAVRDYLVQRGYGQDLVHAHGRGEGHPVADNGSAEGRANNRRVEIVIAHEAQAARAE